MRANVYVDGFNLYYSALRRRFPDCKWLDVRALAETLFPNDEIARVLYFSARSFRGPTIRRRPHAADVLSSTGKQRGRDFPRPVP